MFSGFKARREEPISWCFYARQIGARYQCQCDGVCDDTEAAAVFSGAFNGAELVLLQVEDVISSSDEGHCEDTSLMVEDDPLSFTGAVQQEFCSS